MSAGMLGFLVVLIPVVILLILILLHRPSHDPAEREEAFRTLAQAYGGRLSVREEEPRVTFPWRGEEVLVSEGAQQLKVVVEKPGFVPPTLGIQPRDRAEEGGTEGAFLLVEDPTSPEGREFLKGPAKPLIEDLFALDGSASAAVSFAGSMRITSVAGKNAEALKAFVRQSLRLLEQARVFALRSSEVTILGEAATAVCPVCGGGLGDLRVRCASCRAPHHRECWDYVGRCSTFGCGGTLFEGGFAAQGGTPAGEP